MQRLLKPLLSMMICGALAACQTTEPVETAATAAPKTAPLPPPKPDATPDAPGIAWGTPVNGLCAGVEFVPNQGRYKWGEHVAVRFHLKNVGDRKITLASSKVRQDFAIASDGGGAPLGVYTEKFLGRNEPRQVVLNPGETATLPANRIGFGDVDRRAVQMTTGERMGSMVHCGDGICHVRYRLKFPDFLKRPNDKDVTAGVNWNGEIETGPCAVQIHR